MIKTQAEDPHVLNEVTDPVFSPNCSVRGIKVVKVEFFFLIIQVNLYLYTNTYPFYMFDPDLKQKYYINNLIVIRIFTSTRTVDVVTEELFTQNVHAN